MSCNLAYFNIISDSTMTKQVEKTFGERITWKFWVKYKTVPRKNFIIYEENRTIVCHPSILKEVEDHIEMLI